METNLLSMGAFLLGFLAVCGVGLLILFLLQGDARRTLSRLRGLGKTPNGAAGAPLPEQGLAALLPRLGRLLQPAQAGQEDRLKKRLIQAGMYGQQSILVYLGVQFVLLVAPPVLLGLAPYCLGLVRPMHALVAGTAGAAFGLLAPSFWLDLQRSRRRNLLRRGMPDALDMLVLCLEGGVSLSGAIQRVVGELDIVHPQLAIEMNIVQREIQLGMTAGDAFKKLGERTGLEELSTLASVILQSERFGAGIAQALKVHAESWRVERQQQAEEMAQKAAVKILFPTLLCIFPAVFVVLLGPAAFRISQMFANK